MAQLFFKYGAMNSGKSIDILKVAHNYEEQGKPVQLLTSGVDTRAGRGIIASRIGLERQVTPVMMDTDIYELVKAVAHPLYCVLIDEAQFLTKAHVLQLTRIVDELKIPVMAFGLKNDFKNAVLPLKQFVDNYREKDDRRAEALYYLGKSFINLGDVQRGLIPDVDPFSLGNRQHIGAIHHLNRSRHNRTLQRILETHRVPQRAVGFTVIAVQVTVGVKAVRNHPVDQPFKTAFGAAEFAVQRIVFFDRQLARLDLVQIAGDLLGIAGMAERQLAEAEDGA